MSKRLQTAKRSDCPHPEDNDLVYDRHALRKKTGRLDEMETLLRQVIARQPDYHHAYNALGYSFADRGVRLEEAKRLIQKALEFAPEDPSSPTVWPGSSSDWETRPRQYAFCASLLRKT